MTILYIILPADCKTARAAFHGVARTTTSAECTASTTVLMHCYDQSIRLRRKNQFLLTELELEQTENGEPILDGIGARARKKWALSNHATSSLQLSQVSF